jgi:threonine dehydratase
MEKPAPPSLAAVRANAEAIAPHLNRTPVVRWPSDALALPLPATTRLWLKLEHLQAAGSFKLRSALTVVRNLTEAQRKHGVVTVSAGNFAIACAHAAQAYGTSAIIFMSRQADPYRVNRARAMGADIRLVDNNATAFADAKALAEREGRTFVHPFDGPNNTLGTASVALELDADLPREVNTFVVAVGGGSLISGVAPTIKALRPGAVVYGVEPAGAKTIYESLKLGQPTSERPTGTIADSLAPPWAEPYSFGLVRDSVDEIMLVEDAAMVDAMKTIFRALRMAVEPAAAAALAAIVGNADRFTGGVCAIVCGSNIGSERYTKLTGGMAEDVA